MDSTIKTKKIKATDSTGKIEIDCENKNGAEDIKSIFSELAHPDFYAAMDALAEPAAEILEAPELADRLKPVAVTFRYTADGSMSAILTVKLQMRLGDETVINTPLRKSYVDGDSQRELAQELSAGTVKRLWALEAEARKYLTGKRAQGNLFEDDEQETASQPELPEARQGA